MSADIVSAKCFVIQPFGVKTVDLTGENIDNDEVYNALQKLENIDPKFPVEIIRGDTQPVEKENLLSHISNCIENADFCIADVTGKSSNVFYEMGYARAKDLTVIIICQDPKDIPSDLRGDVLVKYKMSNLSVLANDIKKHFNRVKEHVAKKNETTHENHLPKVLYLPKRNDSLIRQKIMFSKRRIDILQTNLSILQRDFIDDLVRAMEQQEHLELRILTLDPQSVFVNYRANQLEDTEVKIFRAELQNALEVISVRLRKFGTRISIKIYDDFPSQIAFFFDKEILACVVSARGRSRDNCAFLLSSDLPNAEKSFTDHFSDLWNKKSRTYREFGTA